MDNESTQGNDNLDLNIFMMCEKLNIEALSELSSEYHIRTCRPDELIIWMEFPFDNKEDQNTYKEFMINYYNNVYKNKEDEFYKRCLFVCDKNDKPVSTCFVWKAYDKINTIHWFKTLKEYENKGLGRALLSYIMKQLQNDDYPIYLHTQLGSYKAIRLYSDFGFKVITNKTIGNKTNDYLRCLPILKKYMSKEKYERLQFIEAPKEFEEIVKSSDVEEF